MSTDLPVADVRLTKAVKTEAYSAVGYGRTCTDDTCSGGGGRLRKDGLSVECLDCRAGTWRGTDDSVCIGDSGGPAFDAQKRVLGVATVGGIGCSTAYYTRLDPHAAFLRDTVRVEAARVGAVPSWVDAVEGETPDGDGGAPSGDAAASDADPSSVTVSAADEGCAVAPRSRSSAAISAFFAAFLVLLTRACRRSTRPARTTTSSARATRSTGVRTIPAAITGTTNEYT